MFAVYVVCSLLIFFLQSDAVAAATAARLNISKGELLNAQSSSSMAVRLAQAETQILNETKRYLEEVR